MCYALTTLAAGGVPFKLFIAFLFSDHDVGAQFWKDVGLIPSLGVSTLVLKTVTNGNVGGPYLLPHAVLQSQTLYLVSAE
jgi:hypothetical protein